MHTPHVDERFITVRRSKGKQKVALDDIIVDVESFQSANRFSPLRFENNSQINEKEEMSEQSDNILNKRKYTGVRNDRKRPSVVINKYPERNTNFKIMRPGRKDYSEAVKEGKKTVIFTTSMSKGIRISVFNSSLINGTARFVHFHAAKAEKIKHYVIPALIEEQPESVILLF